MRKYRFGFIIFIVFVFILNTITTDMYWNAEVGSRAEEFYLMLDNLLVNIGAYSTLALVVWVLLDDIIHLFVIPIMEKRYGNRL